MTLVSVLKNWQRNPYRLFFPLGVALLVSGVLPWAGFGLGLSGYRSAFHATVQVEGFLMAFALGFLFTFIPRRTATEPPTALEMGIAVGAPIVIAVTAWFEQWIVSQLAWTALIVMLARFLFTRMRRSTRTQRVDPALLWLPFSLVMGQLGALLMAVGPFVAGAWWMHPIGKALLTQGMFTGLCLGLGRLLFPMVLHSRGPAQNPDRSAGWIQLALASAFVATFFLELAFPVAAGWAARAVLSAGMVAFSLDGAKLPTQRGFHRLLLWISGWCIPVGFALMALFPARYLIGEHVLFVGGFTLMVIAISSHVVLSHGGHVGMLRGVAWQLVASSVLLTLALGARTLMAIDGMRMGLWALVASTCVIAAAALWLHLMITRLDPPHREADAG